MSSIVPLVQGSAEWHRYRQSMRNASESPAVLGASPWLTPYGLWLVKTGRNTVTTTAAMARGTHLEPVARAAYEAHTGAVMQPLVLQDGHYSASLDGMTLDGSLIVEVKCPMQGRESSLWKAVEAHQAPRHYAIQVQHQLMVSGAEEAHLWVFDGQEGLLLPIGRDEALMASIRDGWDAFQPFLDDDVAPPLGEGDTVLRRDAAWAEAAAGYLRAKRQAEAAEAVLQQARAALTGIAQRAREQGAGVTVTRYWKQGSVDYKRIPELNGLDMTPYRGKLREEVRVVEAG